MGRAGYLRIDGSSGPPTAARLTSEEGAALALGARGRRGAATGSASVSFGGDAGSPVRRVRAGAGLLGLPSAPLREGSRSRRRARPRSYRRSRGRRGGLASARSWPSSPTSAARSTGSSQLLGARPRATTCSPSRSATPASRSLPRFGELWLVDPETGRRSAGGHAVASGCAQRFAAAAAEERGPGLDAVHPVRASPLTSCCRPRVTGSACSCRFLRAGEAAPVSFQWPLALLALLLVPGAAIAYVLLEARARTPRRRHRAVRLACDLPERRRPVARPAPAPARRSAAGRRRGARHRVRQAARHAVRQAKRGHGHARRGCVPLDDGH